MFRHVAKTEFFGGQAKFWRGDDFALGAISKKEKDKRSSVRKATIFCKLCGDLQKQKYFSSESHHHFLRHLNMKSKLIQHFLHPKT